MKKVIVIKEASACDTCEVKDCRIKERFAPVVACSRKVNKNG